MVRVNLQDGRTITFDLENPEQQRLWDESQADKTFQDSITGAAIVWNGVQHVIPLPRHFHRLSLEAQLVRDGEKVVAERLDYQADDSLLSLVVYRGGSVPMVRINLDRIGWRRFDRSAQRPTRR